ncbi:MAG: TadE/TadG family type IV pilus assembly protein [Acidimicrobiales bacterium]
MIHTVAPRRGLGGRSKLDQRGAAIAEVALVVPLAMALLLGIFTGGSAYFKKISLVDAARDGARFGASLQVPAGGIPPWQQAVKDRVAQLSGGQLVSSDVCAELVVPTNSDLACGVADPAGASTDPSAEAPVRLVKVGVNKQIKLEFVFFTMRPTLSAKIAARYERDTL